MNSGDSDEMPNNEEFIMQHFIRVYTVCKGKIEFQTKEYNIFWKIIT